MFRRRLVNRSLKFAPTVLLALAACGANQLRLESASTVASVSTAVVAASRAALDQVQEQRIRANETLVASDASCPSTGIIYIRLPTQGPQGALCAPGAAPQPGILIVPYDVRPIPESSLKPTVALIGALADYSGAMSKILAEPTPDISKELAGVAEKAGQAKALADGLLGTSLPDPAKILATDQAKSAEELFQLIINLSTEAEKVRDVRELVRSKDPEVAQITADLQKQLTDWLSLSAALDTRIATTRLENYYDNKSGSMTFQERLSFLELIDASRAAQDAVKTQGSALTSAMKILTEARTTLARRLAGHFTAEENRKIAAIEQERILGALKIIATAAKAFI